MAKNPLELANEIISPFNKYKISQEKGRESPSSFFGNQSKRMINMSPNDYFKFVSHQIGSTPDKLMKQREKNPNELTVDDIRSKMRNGTKFDTPWLKLMDKGNKGEVRPYWQEGLHRMLAAGQEYGMDTKFPIYLAYDNDPWNEIDSMSMDDFINYYDEKRSKRQKDYEEQERLEKEEQDYQQKKETALYYGKLLEEVTPELIAQYSREMDDLFKEDFK